MYTDDVYHKSKKVWGLYPFYQFYFEEINKLTQQLFHYSVSRQNIGKLYLRVDIRYSNE